MDEPTIAVTSVKRRAKDLVMQARLEVSEADYWMLVLGLCDAAAELSTIPFQSPEDREAFKMFSEPLLEIFHELEIERDGPDDSMPQSSGINDTEVAETVLSHLDHSTLKILTDGSADEIGALVDAEWGRRGLTRDQV